MTGTAIRQPLLNALFAGSARAAPEAVTLSDETPLGAEGLGISSLALLHAFVALEQEFGVIFDDAAVASARFETLGDLEAFLQTFLAGGASAHAVRA